MNRIALLLLVSLTALLGACAPQARVEQNVIPWLVSATRTDDTVILQGHYLSVPQSDPGDSYVILGADMNGNGGVRPEVVSWTGNRVEAVIPPNVGYGYAFVVVSGIRSTGLPLDLN